MILHMCIHTYARLYVCVYQSMSVYQCVYEFMSVYQYVCLYVCLLKVADIDVHTHNVYRLLLAYDGATSGSRLKQIYVQK